MLPSNMCVSWIEAGHGICRRGQSCGHCLTGKLAQWGGRRRWWEGDGLKGQGDLGGILGVALTMILGRLVNLNSTLLT